MPKHEQPSRILLHGRLKRDMLLSHKVIGPYRNSCTSTYCRSFLNSGMIISARLVKRLALLVLDCVLENHDEGDDDDAADVGNKPRVDECQSRADS